MAGLNFYTQTLINVNEDPDSKVKSPKFKGVTADAEGDKCLFVKRDFHFYKNKPGVGKVLKVTKAPAAKEKLAKVTLKVSTTNGLMDLTNALMAAKKVDKLFCRLDMYIGMEGAEPYIYSTPWVQKGMPFWVEFTINQGENAQAICDKLAKAIKDNHLFLCDKDLIEVDVSDHENVKFNATSEFQRFRKMTVSVFNETQDDADVIAELKANVSEEDHVHTAHDNDVIKLMVRGKEGFGTYSHLIKDLRLPTAANYQWSHIRQEETPILGATYDEFIIEYEAPSTNEGLGAVGQRLNSVTTHVFWVNSNISGTFSSALTNAGLSDNYVLEDDVESRLAELEAAKMASLSVPAKSKGLN